MLSRTMCHHEYDPIDWNTELEEEHEAEKQEDGNPSFLNDESETDVELVTDGGDDE